MPRFRRKRKAFRRTRRKFKKRGRKRRRRPRFSVRRMGTINPDAALVKLKYQERIIVAPVTPAFNFTFSMNSMFDPNTSGAGLQPVGFDQWVTMYSYYQVYGSSCKVEAINLDTDAGFLLCLYPSVANNPKGYGTASEQKYARTTFIGSRNAGTARRVLKSYMSPMRITGQNTSSLNYGSIATASPNAQRFWICSGISADGITFPNPVLNFTITYYAKFYHRINLDES